MAKKIESVRLPKVKRWGKIDDLFETEAGKRQLNNCLLAISAGAYCHVAALSIGIAPTTFSNWIRRGREDSEGRYRDFYDLVVDAIATHSLQIELEVRQSDPKFWLKNGPRRILGNQFIDSLNDDPSLNHNIDGTVSREQLLTGVELSDRVMIDGNQSNDKLQSVDRSLLMNALQELIDSGVDINQLLNSQSANRIANQSTSDSV